MCVIYIFLLLFVDAAWCGTSSTQPTERIVFDTNACSGLRALFDRVIDVHNEKESKLLSYEDIWKMLDRPESVDGVLGGYLTDQERSKFKDGITGTKRILDLKENRPQVEIDIPIFVFNEIGMGMSSKVVKRQSDEIPAIVGDLVFKQTTIRIASAENEHRFRLVAGRTRCSHQIRDGYYERDRFEESVERFFGRESSQ